MRLPERTDVVPAGSYSGATHKTHRGSFWDVFRTLGVRAALGARPTLSATATLTNLQTGFQPVDCSGGSRTFTLCATSGADTEDTFVEILRTDTSTSNTCTIALNSGQTFAAGQSSISLGTRQSVRLHMVGSVWHVLGFGGHDQAGARNALAVEVGRDLFPVSASVASNAMTLTLNPCALDFRSSSLTSGTVNRRTVSTAITLVISSGSTLGTTSALASRVLILAIDNAGTVELAAINAANGTNLTETGLITTTAEGGAGAADSISTIYSTTARTNVPYRVVGFVDSTQTTAGTWASAPTLIQGVGGRVAELAAPVQSMVRLHTGNGYGSTNTVIRRFTTTLVNQGSDITYADSATLGATFTINASGVYAISFSDSNNVGPSVVGISLNSTQLTTAFSSITAGDRLAGSYQLSDSPTCSSWAGFLRVGDVVRPHTAGGVNASLNIVQFCITRVA